MRLFIIFSVAKLRQIAKEESPALAVAHKQYHAPMREKDAVLFQSMVRPDDLRPRGSRCMVLQAESREELDAFIHSNPLLEHDAMDWQVHELLPNYGSNGFQEWFKGKYSKGHEQ